MTDNETFEAALADSDTVGWYPSNHTELVERALGAGEVVIGFIVTPSEGDNTHDTMKWDMWVLTDRGLLRWFVDAENGVEELTRVPSAVVSRASVRVEGVGTWNPRATEGFMRAKASVATVTFTDGSEPLTISGEEWAASWGNHPSELGWKTAYEFFAGFGTLGA